MKRGIFAAILSLSLVLSVFSVSAFAAEYTDTDNHWSKGYVDRWTDYKVVEGYPDGTFCPDDDMTRAEAATVIVRLMNLSDTTGSDKFTDVPANAWYADAIAKCNAAGIMKGVGNNKMDPNGTLTREMMMVMVCRALGIDEAATLDSDKSFSDYGKTSSWAIKYVNALVNAGIVNGVSENTLAPGSYIDRASTMALLGKGIAVYANEAGVYEFAAGATGVVLIVADNVSVTNAPEGTIVVATSKTAGVKVNGEDIVEGEPYVVPPAEDAGDNTGGDKETGDLTSGNKETGDLTSGNKETGDLTSGNKETGL